MAIMFRIGIKQKLALIFFLFFVIFSGTVFVLLTNVQRMVVTTERIVSKNKAMDELTDRLQSSLLDMDANHKKLNLLKKPRYAEYFDKAKSEFEGALHRAVLLAEPTATDQATLIGLSDSYQQHMMLPPPGTTTENSVRWISEQVFSQWMEGIGMAKRQNQQEIEIALQELNETSRISARNGLYGFCISILVGCIGIWFISRAIFSPLKTLKKGLQEISLDKQPQPIILRGGDEFNKLAEAFNDMSRQLNEEENIRTEFIATLSHEIRTPLSSIHESVNMIIEEVFGAINDKQRKFLEIASVEIKRITKLLNYLLNVAVLEMDVRKKKSVQLDTSELVISSTELFLAPAEKKNIKMQLPDFHGCPPLFGVREEMQQVFVNIIGNAVKYSPENGMVTLSWLREKKNFLLFRVADTGPGVSDDEKSLIFTKYYRTKSARGHLDGVGLGLAISRRIVTGYGGRIEVTNNTGAGCTFSFTLPTHPSRQTRSV
jgi:signal transduction histidine kinase